MAKAAIDSFSNVQPNLNAEIYRDYSVAVAPRLQAPYIEVIKINPDGVTLVGSSDLTGRYWDGAATVSNSSKEAIDTYNNNNEQRKMHVQSGVTDGCFLDSDKLVLFEDSGCLSIWVSPDGSWSQGKWNMTESVTEHDDTILTGDVLQPTDSVITGAADGCIKVWDLARLVARVSNDSAHNHAVTQVTTKPHSSTVFASSSLDKIVCLWDTNIPENRTVAKLKCGVRSLCWFSENELLCGSDAGQLLLVDIRGGQGDGPFGILKEFAEFPNAINKIVKNEGNIIGVATDTNVVHVARISKYDNLEILYKNSSHLDDVKTVCFDSLDPDTLYSGSWDGTILAHNYKAIS